MTMPENSMAQAFRGMLDPTRPWLDQLDGAQRAIVLRQMISGFLELAISYQTPQEVAAQLRELADTLQADPLARG